MKNKTAALIIAGITAFLVSSCASLTAKDIKELAQALPRHDSFNYLTRRNLPETWFETAHDTLEDPHLYIILSNTGSAANKLIGIFTRADYNHVSLAFDRNLETLVSYNGGNGLYTPGMNPERIKDLCQKPDTSLAVFKLKVSAAQKALILRRIGEINHQGSSYNLLGIVLKRSFKPNIMFCSQFVYTMLEKGGLNYFEKKHERVRPMDFIKLDKGRALEFVYALETEAEGLSTVRRSSQIPGNLEIFFQ
jgi:hypothetical protein